MSAPEDSESYAVETVDIAAQARLEVEEARALGADPRVIAWTHLALGYRMQQIMEQEQEQESGATRA